MHLIPSLSTAFLFISSSPKNQRRLRQWATPTTTTTTIETPQKYKNLLQWLTSNNATISDKVEIKPSSRGGFGAFVGADAKAEELLFAIPRKCCVTLENALQEEATGASFQQLIDKAGPGGNTVVMAGFLAQEWLKILHDGDDGESNPFGPYLQTLPWERGVNNQEHVLFWSDDDIEKHLRGSMCYSEAAALREEVDLAIKVMNAMVSKTVRQYRGEAVQEGGFKWPWEVQPENSNGALEGLPEAMRGAFVSLLTRSFQDGDGDEEKLVPMLDMLQHSDDPNIAHVMRESDGTVEVRARTALQAGDELLNQYRPEVEESMPYHRFFSRYGFVPGIQEPIKNLLSDKSSIFFPQKVEV